MEKGGYSHKLAMGYGGAYGSAFSFGNIGSIGGGGLVASALEKRVPFNIESFRAEETMKSGNAEGGMVMDEPEEECWNPFVFSMD